MLEQVKGTVMQNSLFPKECRVVNLKKEPYDVYIGRGSKWGNPYTIGRDGNRDEVCDKYVSWFFTQQVCDKYVSWFFTQPQLIASLPELAGKTLGCFCKPKRCHGDFLVEQVKKYLEKN